MENLQFARQVRIKRLRVNHEDLKIDGPKQERTTLLEVGVIAVGVLTALVALLVWLSRR